MMSVNLMNQCVVVGGRMQYARTECVAYFMGGMLMPCCAMLTRMSIEKMDSDNGDCLLGRQYTNII